VGNWNQPSIEQVQPVRFYFGYVIDRRAPLVAYNAPGYLPRWQPEGITAPHSGQVFFGGLSAGLGFVPNLPSVEYTVLLDKGTMSADHYLYPEPLTSVIVVQNEQFQDEGLAQGSRAVIRVVGNQQEGYSARVMRADALETVENRISASQLRVPLNYVPPPPPPPPRPPYAPTRIVRLVDP
jgi:hypothetical protein